MRLMRTALGLFLPKPIPPASPPPTVVGDARRCASDRADKTELLERCNAVVQPDLLGDFAIFDP